jgi:tetratricopeptide (TPR) repeat protein
MRNIFVACIVATCLALLAPTAHSQGERFEVELAAIQSEWAIANYNTSSDDAKVQALAALSKRADAFVAANPRRAEPLIWQGIVLSTYAGARGGLGALKIAKQSRASLQAAIDIDPKALDGSAYTSLGTLYFKVPGFPVGFGNEDKARKYLQQALTVSPDGIDPNFFYGEFLLEQHQTKQALEHLQKALHAPARPGRELADAGRRREIEALIAKIRGQRVARGE